MPIRVWACCGMFNAFIPWADWLPLGITPVLAGEPCDVFLYSRHGHIRERLLFSKPPGACSVDLDEFLDLVSERIDWALLAGTIQIGRRPAVKTRAEIIEWIGEVISGCKIGTTLEALLIVASTVANSASPQSVEFSSPKVEETADAMMDVLREAFGLE